MAFGPYEAVPYPARPLRRAHPDRLATLARLFGMTPAPVTECRVLEVGCSDGGNLLAMALTLPASRFDGFDLAAKAIASGQEAIRHLKIGNVHLSAANLLEWDAGGAKYDYVIAHGFYSWVPPQVRDRLFEVIAAVLEPQGVAYVSYNVYPGCYLRRMMAGMMHLHADRIPDPMQRVSQSRELMRFLVAGQPGESHAGRILREEAGQVLSESDENVFHDDLAEINDPVWFRDFAAHAGRFGLAYLTESELYSTSDHHLPEPVRQVLREMDATDREQYLDFLKLRRFRGSLLVGQGACASLELHEDEVERLLVSSALEPVSAGPSLEPGAVVVFQDRSGIPLQLDHPLSKAALLHLRRQHPRAVHFGELAQAATAMVAPQAVSADDVGGLRSVLFRGFQAGLVELATHQPDWAVEPGDRPKASPLARYQAARKQPFVSTLRHLPVNIDDELATAMLPLLDGTRDLDRLASELKAAKDDIRARLQTAARQALLIP